MALRKELGELVAHSIISTQTAQDIERYYAAKQQPANGNLLLTIFGIVGSALVGLGIILIFAHNWDDFTKPVKTGLAFLPLLLAQGLAAFCILKKKSTAWKESAATLLFFAVGASIALVAQIYNLPGNLPAFICTWALLCLPLVYVLQSQMSVILTLIFATWYAGQFSFSHSQTPWMYLVFIAALLPLYLNRLKLEPNSNFVTVMGWLLPVSAGLALTGFLQEAGLSTLLLYMALCCLSYNISNLPVFAKNHRAATGYRACGLLGMVIILVISSFHGAWQIGLYIGIARDNDLYVCSILLISAISCAVIIYRQTRAASIYMLMTLLFPALFYTVLLSDILPAIAANLLLLATSILTIKRGIDRVDFKVLNFGLLLIALQVSCRFFDLDMSFALRGLMFLAVGAGFFTANYALAKKKKNNTLIPQPHEN